MCEKALPVFVDSYSYIFSSFFIEILFLSCLWYISFHLCLFLVNERVHKLYFHTSSVGLPFLNISL